MMYFHLGAHWVARLVDIVLIVAGAWIVGSLGRRAIGRMEDLRLPRNSEMKARRSTLYRLLSSGLRYVVDFVALIMVLNVCGISATSLLAGAGIVGLALAFGAQGLVQDVMTGLFILYEGQYAVSDFITLPGLSLSGTVLELGIRITRLRGSGGDETIVPNRLILEVQNHTRGQQSVSIVIPLLPIHDPAATRRGLERMVEEIRHQIPGVQLLGVVDIQPDIVSWGISAPVQCSNASEVGYLLRERVATAIYEGHLPLAGAIKGGSEWTSPNTQ